MLRKLFHYFIASRRKETPFIIFFWFLISFLIARTWTWLMAVNIIPDIYLFVKGVHVHHFNYGIVFLAITGFIAIAFRDFSQKHIHGLAVLYGIGLGIAFDEFSLWLLLEDNYWARQSYDAIMVISLIFLNIIYIKGFWMYLGRKMQKIKVVQTRLFPKK